MVDRAFSEPRLAALYDPLCGAGRADFAFYLPLVLAARSVHAFQVLLDDDEVHAALTAMRSALLAGGRVAFETRNPAARAWTDWTRDRVREFVAEGGRYRYWSEVEGARRDSRGCPLVTFTATYAGPEPWRTATSRSTLRFLDVETLGMLLDAAGLVVEAQFGDWDRSAVGAGRPEIITIARPVG